MSADKKTLKFQMMMSPSEAEMLDDWMFKHRVRSRAEAIRRLVQVGMLAEEALAGLLDAAAAASEKATADMVAVLKEHEAILSPSTKGTAFTSEEMEFVLIRALRRAFDSADAIGDLFTQILSIGNAMEPLVEAKSLVAGIAVSKEILDETQKALASVRSRAAEPLEDNLYWIAANSPALREWFQHYETLPDNEKGPAVRAMLRELHEERQNDPKAFAERHGTAAFWEKPMGEKE